jgi:spore coat polysaccharide biosynthesis predicted glycosyltransferase SpsG
VAVTAGGGTLYEIAFLGIPGIVLCQCGHQQENASRFQALGTVINLGDAHKVSRRRIADTLAGLLSDKAKRKEMSRKGKNLIDGGGRRRVTRMIMELTE